MVKVTGIPRLFKTFYKCAVAPVAEAVFSMPTNAKDVGVRWQSQMMTGEFYRSVVCRGTDR